MSKIKIKTEETGPSHKDPYQVIADFFSFADLVYYRKYILSMLKAAYSEGYWKKSYPADLLIFQEQMLELIRAAHQFISAKKTQKIKPAIIDDEIFSNGKDITAYAGINKENELWNFFPRYLTKKEFVNPWLAFKKVLTFKSCDKWESDLNNILFYALSPLGKESALEYDYLSINIQLQKLVEAAHLIRVRTNNFEGDKEKSGYVSTI